MMPVTGSMRKPAAEVRPWTNFIFAGGAELWHGQSLERMTAGSRSLMSPFPYQYSGSFNDKELQINAWVRDLESYRNGCTSLI